MADHIIDRTPNVKWVIIIVLPLFAGILSALADNAAAVLMAAPVALVVSGKRAPGRQSGLLRVSAVPRRLRCDRSKEGIKAAAVSFWPAASAV